MSRNVLWGFVLAVVLVALWQLLVQGPWVAPWACGVVLLVAGYLTGLRSGADSQANLVDDLVRRNKLLGDQNRDLVEVNQELLRTRQDCESDAIQSTPTE